MRRSLQTEARPVACISEDTVVQRARSVQSKTSLTYPERLQSEAPRAVFQCRETDQHPSRLPTKKGRQYAALENGREDQEEDASCKQ